MVPNRKTKIILKHVNLAWFVPRLSLIEPDHNLSLLGGDVDKTLKQAAKLGSLAIVISITLLTIDHCLLDTQWKVEAAVSHLVINELDLNPMGSDDGHEWIELYNPTNSVIDINGWWLETTTRGRIDNHTFGPIKINPGARIVLLKRGLRLENENESLLIKDYKGNVVDQTPLLSDTEDSHWAWCRCPDGGPEWQLRYNTPGKPNVCMKISEETPIIILGIILFYPWSKINSFQ